MVGGGHVDALAAEGDPLGDQPPALTGALGEAAVGADHAPPGQVGVVGPKEDGAGEAGGAGGDVAVAGDKAGGDRAHPLQHFEFAVGGGRGQGAAGPKASMIRFWNSLSSSGEMK